MRIISFIVATLTIISCSKKGSEGSTSSDPSLDASILRGEAVYKQSCIACHMADASESASPTARLVIDFPIDIE